MASVRKSRPRVPAVPPGAVRFRPSRSAARALAAAVLFATTAAGQGMFAQAPAQASQPLADVPVLPSDTLRDVALTALVRGRPVIFYNPALLDHVGSELARFFLAHEYGHIAGGHSGGALGADDPAYSRGRRAQELEADCYAARRLGTGYPASVAAAIRFFRLARGFRFDDLHPSGAERAARIAECAPGESAGPVELAPIAVILRSAGNRAPRYAEARLWIDQVPVGTISNLRAGTRTLTLRGLELGDHTYLIEFDAFHLDEGYQLVPLGTVETSGQVTVAAGDTLVVEWEDGTPSIVRSAR